MEGMAQLLSRRSRRDPVRSAVLQPVRAIRGCFAFHRRFNLFQLRVGEDALPVSVGALVHERFRAFAKQHVGFRHDRGEFLLHATERNSLQDPGHVLFVNDDIEVFRDASDFPLGSLE